MTAEGGSFKSQAVGLLDDLVDEINAERVAKGIIFGKWTRPKRVRGLAEAGRKGYFFTFTLFAKQKTDLDTHVLAARFKQKVVLDQRVNFCLYELEHTKDGKPHLQGFIVFQDKRRRHDVAKLIKYAAWNGHIGSVYVREMKGSPRQNIAYCSKEQKKHPDTEYYEFVNRSPYFY